MLLFVSKIFGMMLLYMSFRKHIILGEIFLPFVIVTIPSRMPPYLDRSHTNWGINTHQKGNDQLLFFFAESDSLRMILLQPR